MSRTPPPGRARYAGPLVTALNRAVLARDYDPGLGYTPCVWCGGPADTADHWPVSRVDGAPDTPAACVSACRSCNSSRGATMGNKRRNAPRPSRAWGAVF
jgi:hypothetical protein